VRLVRDTTTLVPEVHPYAWSATRTGGTLTLAGHAPKPALRTLMLQLADASRGSATMVDSTTPAIGAPAAWDAGVTAALAAVGRLSDGKATLSDATLSLSGVSATPAAHAELLSLWTRLPSGIERGSFAVTPPVLAPYGWSASRAGAVTTLTGAVPSPELRAGQLLAAGRGAIDQTRFGAGEPPFYAAAASHALAVLSKLPTGSATLGDTGLAIIVGRRNGATRLALTILNGFLQALHCADLNTPHKPLAHPRHQVGNIRGCIDPCQFGLK
jgi:OOP family OmpA-OmpF porin